MATRDHGWDGLILRPSTPGGDEAAVLARQAARVFGSADGAAVLAHLRKMTLDRCLGPESGEPALRHLEGQRHLVLHLLALAARGRDGQ
jgi:hypothetical protein